MLKPSSLTIVYQHNGGYVFYTVIKNFDGVEVVSGHNHMTKRDALDWCNREYHGVPVNYV
jgi:hypothetical protein